MCLSWEWYSCATALTNDWTRAVTGLVSRNNKPQKDKALTRNKLSCPPQRSPPPGGQTAEGSMNTKSRHSSALCNRCGRDQLRRNCTNKHLCTLASACPEQTRARPQLRCWSCDFNSPALRVSRVSRTAVWPSCTFPTPHGQRC